MLKAPHSPGLEILRHTEVMGRQCDPRGSMGHPHAHDELDMTGKVCLVGGGSRGMGCEIARAYTR